MEFGQDFVMGAAARVLEVIAFLVLAAFSRKICSRRFSWASDPPTDAPVGYCLSWRLAVEANNVRSWRTVPSWCLRHVEDYMTGGQYERDIELIVDQAAGYVKDIDVSEDGMDAWILDIDDTCISNLVYYRGRRYGVDPFDGPGFVAWAVRGECPAIPLVLRLFQRLIEAGFKVILVTGRDKASLGEATIANLQCEGFDGYERLIMRTVDWRGKGAVAFKSGVRKQLVEEGYRIWGNVGDQWSDLQGEFVGNRTFKIPNPMYFVP
ncbi:hypothetical protein MLD38_038352 [Melastoma candidum]|uniref:Uncharacterized protein n=1 Tax=Melastoma candidum TaxID=119954 RepID=A0ACB9KZH1_9MYRT|nr:hypothetical protein MLD38_038352 [Melastoma candidum]